VASGKLLKYFLPVSWVLWGILFLALLWGLAMALFEEDQAPEVSPVFGVLVMGVLLVAFVGVGLLLFWATRRRSTWVVITLALLFAYPILLGIASPLVHFWESWQFEKELSKVGDFPDPAARALAEKIQSGDIAGLQKLLENGPPPTAHDKAGNDLLAIAAEVVRDSDGDAEIVRVLLEAGMDPTSSRTPDGSTLLHFMVLDRSPPSVEVVRLLLDHGADPNAEDPQTGMTAMADAGAQPEFVRLLTEAGADIDQLLPGGESMLVRFISMQHWDSALYLIQQGANLEVTNPDGLSVDSYLKEYSDSVYGQHPEGWERVREAIQTRRR
jgi:hypothetical protein